MELEECDVKALSNKLGVVKKIIRLKKTLTGPAPGSGPRLLTPMSVHSLSDGDSDFFSPGPSSPPYPSSTIQSTSSTPVDTDDTASLATSAAAMVKSNFCIPDSWPPSIMACIQQSTEEEESSRPISEE